MELLADQVAVITGGASGIGLAMAKRFAAEGMRIVLADIERPVLSRAGDELAGAGADVLTVPTDVSVADDVEALAATTLAHFGDVHLVCNNAGVGSRGLPIAELPLDDFAWVVSVNLFGVIHGIGRSFPTCGPTASATSSTRPPSPGSTTSPGWGRTTRPRPPSSRSARPCGSSSTPKPAASVSRCCARVGCGRTSRRRTATGPSGSPTRWRAARWRRRPSTRRAAASSWRPSRCEPAEIADQVCDAVRTNRFYVITHPESVPAFAERARRIVAGENPVEPPQ